MSTIVGVLLVVLGVATGFFSGYKTRERRFVRDLHTAINNQYVETAQDLADWIDPNKPGRSGNSSDG